jgi:hypothetical protein
VLPVVASSAAAQRFDGVAGNADDFRSTNANACLQRPLALVRTAQPVPAEASVDRSKWDMNERNKIRAAREVNGWQPGISRKVLWEKMREFQIFDEEPEIRTVG